MAKKKNIDIARSETLDSLNIPAKNEYWLCSILKLSDGFVSQLMGDTVE